MRKPEAPEDDATVDAGRNPAADEERAVKERLQLIEERIADLRKLLKRFRKKLQ
jgi:hypothetical protein